ncbi:MAG: RNase adapter RapZ [Firmicutes bacterium]|nr:RNase adapter RapZ [Bacillota bacterium]MBR5731742.1 RNase adapter RapZ [Bacillota bacterium]
MELIIVTGLSGAGKSHAANCLEDLGFYCVDNMPPRLMTDFLRLAEDKGEFEKVAFVTDIRGRYFFGDLIEALDELTRAGIEYKIIFLEATTPAIVRRYKETRRAHPMAPQGDIEAGIEKEREKLADVKSRASIVIDTSDLKVAQLNSVIKGFLSAEDKDSFTLTIMSFGYKHGMPDEADWVLDVRFLPNPFYVPTLKELTGRNKKVREYVLSKPEAGKFASRVTGLILDLIPSYIKEGKYHLTVAFGCTGGRHRSVVIAETVAERLEEIGRLAAVKHRDL